MHLSTTTPRAAPRRKIVVESVVGGRGSRPEALCVTCITKNELHNQCTWPHGKEYVLRFDVGPAMVDKHWWAPAPKRYAQHASQKTNCITNAHVMERVCLSLQAPAPLVWQPRNTNEVTTLLCTTSDGPDPQRRPLLTGIVVFEF
jgi:hypothetical protein